MSKVTYEVKPVEFGEAITPVTGNTTINGLDHAVVLAVEKTAELEDGTIDAQSVVVTMTLEQAAEMSRALSDAVALARFKSFIAPGRTA